MGAQRSTLRSVEIKECPPFDSEGKREPNSLEREQRNKCKKKKRERDRKQKTQTRFLTKVSLVSLKLTAAGDLDKTMGEGMDLR